jgi:exosortase/archaeosortase family protein
MLRFTASFILIWLLAQVIVAYLPIQQSFIEATVATVALVLRAVALPVSVAGATITLAGTSIEVVGDCTPLPTFTILAAAIVSFPARAQWRVLGWSVGLLLLWIFNLVRISGLLILLTQNRDAFAFVHLYVWQGLGFVVVLGIFAAWVSLAPRHPLP